MTYGLLMSNPLYAAVVTDRRITGVKTDEESTKCGVLVLRDGRLGYSFTGLAEVPGGYRAEFQIPELLLEAAKARPTVDSTLAEFASMLTAQFRVLRDGRGRVVSHKDKRLAVAFAGFITSPFGMTSPHLALVSNFDSIGQPAKANAERSFSVSHHSPATNQISILAIGSIEPKQADLAPVSRLLRNGNVPAQETVDAAVEAIRSASNAMPGGPIGARCSSLVVPRDGSQQMAVDYHPDSPMTTVYMPAYVYARYDAHGAFCLVHPSTESHDDSGKPAINRVPRVERRRPCLCGSGRQYRRCHGRR